MEILENNNNNLIIKNNNKIDFFSYNTFIASYFIDTKKLLLNTEMWQYSQTTTKQFKNFINNYTTFEYKDKKSFEKEIEKSINGNFDIQVTKQTI